MLGRGQTGLWANVMNFVQAQDRSLDLLTSSPARYHCTTVAPDTYEMMIIRRSISPAIYSYYCEIRNMVDPLPNDAYMDSQMI